MKAFGSVPTLTVDPLFGASERRFDGFCAVGAPIGVLQRGPRLAGNGLSALVLIKS
jgi:hypothetical protein